MVISESLENISNTKVVWRYLLNVKKFTLLVAKALSGRGEGPSDLLRSLNAFCDCIEALKYGTFKQRILHSKGADKTNTRGILDGSTLQLLLKEVNEFFEENNTNIGFYRMPVAQDEPDRKHAHLFIIERRGDSVFFYFLDSEDTLGRSEDPLLMGVVQGAIVEFKNNEISGLSLVRAKSNGGNSNIRTMSDLFRGGFNKDVKNFLSLIPEDAIVYKINDDGQSGLTYTVPKGRNHHYVNAKYLVLGQLLKRLPGYISAGKFAPFFGQAGGITFQKLMQNR